jgi:hypothetical protein
MSSRSLLVMAVLALAMAVYFYMHGLSAPGTSEIQEQQRKVALVAPSDVRRIELTNPDGAFVFSKKDAGWDLEKPVAYPASSSAVGTLLSEIEFAERRATIDRAQLGDIPGALKKFGLNPPRDLLRLTTGGDVIELAVGNETSRSGTYYAMVTQGGKAQELIVADKGLVEQLSQNLAAWRDHQVFHFASDKAEDLLLKKEQQEVEVSRKDGAWKILKPLETLADQGSVDGYLSLLLGLQARAFVSETGADLPQAGLTSPQFTLEVKLSGGGSQILRVGQPVQNDPTAYYAQFGDRPAVFTLPKEAVDALAQLLDKVRDRRLAGMTAQTIVELAVTTGTQRVELKREDSSRSGWILPLSGGREADGRLMERLLDALENSRVSSFLGSVATPDPAYGLQKPQMTIQVKVQRGKNPPTEDVIKIGAAKGDELYVQSSFIPFVVTLPKTFLDSVPKQVWDWFTLSVTVALEADVTALEWVTPGGSLAVTKQGDGSWKAGREGVSVDSDYLYRQLGMLDTLPVARWNGPVAKKDFAKPALTLRVTTAKGVRELVFAPVEKNGLRMAWIAGDGYAFTVAEEVYQKLQLQPIKAADAPTPAPPAAAAVR